MKINGQAITDGLCAFNEWRDNFLMELSTLMLMIGFIVGTVDVFTSGGLSRIEAFNVAWAVVQAIAIDGLFFAVWGRIRRATWSWATVFSNMMLILVGLLLSLVASLINNILSYQELNGIAQVKDVFTHLGLDQALFSYGRSILVVLVAILVALFARNYGPLVQATEQELSIDQAEVARLIELNNGLQASIKELQATCARLRGELAVLRSQGYVAADSGTTIAITNESGLTVMAMGSHRDRIKQAMLQAMQEGKEIDYKAIARLAQVGYSTVKKWAPEIKQQLALMEGQDNEFSEPVTVSA